MGTELASNEIAAKRVAAFICKGYFRALCGDPDCIDRRKGPPEVVCATETVLQADSRRILKHLCLDGILNAFDALAERRTRRAPCLYHAGLGDLIGMAVPGQEADRHGYCRVGALPCGDCPVVCGG